MLDTFSSSCVLFDMISRRCLLSRCNQDRFPTLLDAAERYSAWDSTSKHWQSFQSLLYFFMNILAMLWHKGWYSWHTTQENTLEPNIKQSLFLPLLWRTPFFSKCRASTDYRPCLTPIFFRCHVFRERKRRGLSKLGLQCQRFLSDFTKFQKNCFFMAQGGKIRKRSAQKGSVPSWPKLVFLERAKSKLIVFLAGKRRKGIWAHFCGCRRYQRSLAVRAGARIKTVSTSNIDHSLRNRGLFHHFLSWSCRQTMAANEFVSHFVNTAQISVFNRPVNRKYADEENQRERQRETFSLSQALTFILYSTIIDSLHGWELISSFHAVLHRKYTNTRHLSKSSRLLCEELGSRVPAATMNGKIKRRHFWMTYFFTRHPREIDTQRVSLLFGRAVRAGMAGCKLESARSTPCELLIDSYFDENATGSLSFTLMETTNFCVLLLVVGWQ